MKSEWKNGARFPGICQAAKAIGVSREHLYRVLIGERSSPSLIRRYKDYAWHILHNKKPRTTPAAQTKALRNAAPDLLAACELALDCIDQPFKDPAPAIDALEKAIAKAKSLTS